MKWLLLVTVVGIVGVTMASVFAFGAPFDAPKMSHGIGHSVGLGRSAQVLSGGAR